MMPLVHYLYVKMKMLVDFQYIDLVYLVFTYIKSTFKTTAIRWMLLNLY